MSYDLSCSYCRENKAKNWCIWAFVQIGAFLGLIGFLFWCALKTKQ